MRAARELAGGDSGRIIMQRDGSVLVANRPRLRPGALPACLDGFTTVSVVLQAHGRIPDPWVQACC